MAYKSRLSIFEIKELAEAHADSLVFIPDKTGAPTVEAWMKVLRYHDAWKIAERILERDIEEAEFRKAWANTPAPPEPPPSESAPPNTATFGGYRLWSRPALNRDKRKNPRPGPKSKWRR